MSTETYTPAFSTETRALDFTAVRPPFYQLCPGVTILDIRDQLAAKQVQLNAMLVAGAAIDDCYGASISDYFWACRSAAEEIAALTAELTHRMDTERAAA